MIVLLQHCHCTFSGYDIAGARSAVGGHIGIYTLVAILALIFAVPLEVLISGVKHQIAISIVDIDAEVFQDIVGIELEGAVSAEGRRNDIGEPYGEETYRHIEPRVGTAVKLIEAGHLDIYRVFAKVGEGMFYLTIYRGLAIAEVPQGGYTISGYIAEGNGRIFTVDEEGRDLYRVYGIMIYLDLLA